MDKYARLLFLIGWVGLVPVSSAQAAISLVQHVNNSGGGFSLTTALPSASTVGNILIVAVVADGGVNSVAVTDDKSGGSNSYHADVQYFTGGCCSTYIFSAPNAGSANHVTANLGASTGVSVAAYEFSGVATVSPFDVGTYQNNAAAISGSSGSTPSTAMANELLVGVVSLSSGSGTITGSAARSITLQDVVPAAPNSTMGVETGILSSAGAAQLNFSWSVSSTSTVMIAAYKPAAGTTSQIRHRVQQD